MSELLRFFKDMRDNGYGLAEIAAQLSTSAIAEPVAGFAAMYDPVHGADAIREGMTYQPRTQEAQQYSQSIGNAAKTAIKPTMPIIDTWKKGVDIAGQYSPVVGAGLRTVPTAIGIAMGAKPALQTGRNMSEGLGAMQGRMVANANAPRTLNAGFRGQRGAVGLTNDFDNSDEIKIIADYLGQSPESMLVNRDLYTQKQGAINSLVSRYEQMDDFSGAYYPTSYGYISISPSAKSNGQWQLTSFDHKMNPLSDQGEMPKNKALTEFFKTIKPNKYGNSTPKKPLTEFEQAHLTAQRNAALPVNQGGLGLPADNTAMDRARAMGFDVDNPVYHGTNADIDAFNTSGKGKTKGAGAFFSDSPIIPETYISGNQGGNIIPAFVKDDNLAVFDAKGANWNDIPVDSLSFKRKKASDLLGLEKGDYTSTDELASFAKDKGFGGVKVKNLKDRGANSDINRAKEYLKEKYGITPNQDWDNVTGNQFVEARDYVENLYKKTKSTITAVQDPKNIRSRFAAFDPFNRDSSNLLATTAPLVPTTALGAYMYNEKRKKSQGNQ